MEDFMLRKVQNVTNHIVPHSPTFYTLRPPDPGYLCCEFSAQPELVDQSTTQSAFPPLYQPLLSADVIDTTIRYVLRSGLSGDC